MKNNKLNNTYSAIIYRIVALCCSLLFILNAKADAYEYYSHVETNTGGLNTLANFPYLVDIDDPDKALGTISYQEAQNIIMLSVDPDIPVTNTYTATVNFSITVYENAQGQSLPLPNNPIELSITYDPNNANPVSIIDRDAYIFEEGHKVHVVINSFSIDNPGANYSNLKFENTIRVFRLHNLSNLPGLDGNSCSSTITNMGNTLLTSSNEIQVSWNDLPCAEAYQLEWLHVNNYDGTFAANGTPVGNVPLNLLRYNFNFNSTRIETTETSYKVSNVFELGYVLFRVRALTYHPNDHDLPIYGEWSAEASSLGSTHPANAIYQITTTNYHEDDEFNWQYSASYAEEGKKKEVVTYMDGTLRNHQVVTKINTDENVIVGETYYDHQGRAVVQALPVPTRTEDAEIGFYQNFNRNNFNAGYSRSDFDFNQNSCENIADEMRRSNGASNYYSNQNPNKVGFQAYVPDALGYPFTHIEYEPDNTGRVRRQGGLGNTHQLNSDGKHTKYFYSKPSQEELNRLFGAEAGYDYRYQKNMVIDPNGQASISYVDVYGRTVATSLAGEPPANLNNEPLFDSDDIEEMTINIINKEGEELSSAPLNSVYHHLVSQAGNHSFNYQLNCGTTGDGSVCSECVYNLEIEVRDECGALISLTNSNGTPLSNPYTTSVCDAGAADSEIINFNAVLTIGKYIISRTLSFDQENLQDSVEECITSSPDTKTLNEFVTEALSQIDESLCETPSCETRCEVEFPDGGTALEECLRDCRYPNWCSSVSNIMRGDFIPTDANSEDNNEDLFEGDFFTLDDTEGGSTYDDFSATLGQYAMYTVDANGNVNGLDCSIFDESGDFHYEDINFNGITVTGPDGQPLTDGNGNNLTPDELTPQQFIGFFDPAWIDAMMAHHPENACLLDCEAISIGREYDYLMMNVDSYEEALAMGFLDPLELGIVPSPSSPDAIGGDPFFDSPPGSGYSTQMQNLITFGLLFNESCGGATLNTGGIWGTAVAMAVCEGTYSNPCNAAGVQACQTLINNFNLQPIESVDICTRDAVWHAFRALYLSKKMEVYQQYREDNSDCDAPCGNSHFPSNEELAGDYDDYITLDNQTEINEVIAQPALDEIENQCEERAAYLANTWIEKLEGCGLQGNCEANVRAGLIAVFEAACDGENPMGASNLPDGETATATGNTYSSFEDVLTQLSGGCFTIDLDCNADLITFPLGHGHSYSSLSVSNQLDECACDIILETDAEFRQLSPPEYPEDVNYASDYFEHVNGFRLDEYSKQVCLCTSARDISDQNGVETPDWSQEAIDFLESAESYISAELGCQNCVECEALETSVEDYNKYGLTLTSSGSGISFVPVGIGTNPTQNPELLADAQTAVATYLNNIHDMDMSFEQYNEFVKQCNGAGSNDDCELTPVGTSFINVLNEILSEGTLNETNCLCKEPYFDEYEEELAIHLNPNFDSAPICNDIYTPTISQDGKTINAYVANNVPMTCNWTIAFSNPNLGEEYQIQNIVYPLQNIQYTTCPAEWENDEEERCFLAEVSIAVGGSVETVTIFAATSCYDIWECELNPELCSERLIIVQEDNCEEMLEYEAMLDATSAYETYVEELTNETEENLIEACHLTADSEVFDMTYDNAEYHYTLYYYDLGGNLVRTIPPEGVEFVPENLWNQVDQDRDNDTRTVFTNHRMETRYKYNSLNQLTHQTMPDHENTGSTSATSSTNGLPAGIEISSAVFFDANNGVIFGSNNDPIQPAFITNDGGISWTQTNLPSTPNPVGASTLTPGGNVHYTTNFGSFPGHCISTNGGQSASSCTGISGVLNSTTANELHFFDDDHGVIVADAGSVIVSIDAGESWSALNNPVLNGVNWNDVYMVDFNACYIVGDGGQIVKIQNIFSVSPTYFSMTATTENLNSITFCGSVGYIAGDNGTLLKIEDYANNADITVTALTGPAPNFEDWVSCTNTPPAIGTVNLNDIESPDNCAQIYAVGDDSVILKSTDGGNSWVRIDDHGNVGDILEISFMGSESFVLSTTQAPVGTPPLTIVTDQTSQWSTRYFYDKLGRIVASQNSKQYNYSPSRYSYTRYDHLGRVVEVGELRSNTEPTDAILNATNYPDNWSNSRLRIFRTYYDYPIDDSIDELFFQLFGTNGQEHIRNRVANITYDDSCSPCSNNTNFYNSASHFSYDIHGNVKHLIQENKDLADIEHSRKTISYDYDLISGNVHQVAYQVRKDGAEPLPDRFFHRYEYDADNRITNAYTSTDGIIWDRDANYQYYRHGPLARTEIGDLRVQGCDYAYTIQGWVKAINSNTLNTADDIGEDGTAGSNVLPDVYGYGLGYYDGDYQAIGTASGANNFTELNTGQLGIGSPDLFNGNISKMITAISPTSDAPAGTLIAQGSAYQYDQLNRIINSRTFNIGGGNFANEAYNTSYTYDANGNILTLNRNGKTSAGNVSTMDNLSYHYQVDGNGNMVNNKLLHVNDPIADAFFTEDIDDQGTYAPKDPSTHNYIYDEIGNLTKDKAEEIGLITWRVDGKVERVIRETGSTLPDLYFEYDASGNRISKAVKKKDQTTGVLTNETDYTYYVRDASGNVMAVYDKEVVPESAIDFHYKFSLDEHHIYGSKRLGLYERDRLLVEGDYTIIVIEDDNSAESRAIPAGPINIPYYTPYFSKRSIGSKRYELSNHLGNVLATVSDRRLWDGNDFIADLRSTSDYYPFGMAMMGRGAGNGYRYGFNGEEVDDEIYGNSNSYDFGARNYDPRIGRFRSMDMYASVMPAHSPYSYALNNPLYFVDEDGMYPKPSEILAKAGIEMPPLAAGILDGLIDGTAVGTAGFVWDLATDSDFRKSMGDALVAIATDPIGTLGSALTEKKESIERLLAGNATDKDKYAVGEFIGGAITGLITGGGIAKLMKGLANPCGCFTDSTLVYIEDGLKPISEIQVGDKVWAYNDSTKVKELKRVTHTFQYERDTLYSIYIDSITIETTSDHPFFIDNEWIDVKDLAIGDSLSLFTGDLIQIDSIAIIPKETKVYNFTVEDFNTYYVTENGILVHNAGPCDFKPVNLKGKPGGKQLNKEIKEIVASRGTRRLDENGNPQFYENRNNTAQERKWAGSEEYEVKVPGQDNVYRILKKTTTNADGTTTTMYGYTTTHYEKGIYEFEPKTE